MTTTCTSASRAGWQLWVRWGYSPLDRLCHAFEVDYDRQRGRRMTARCGHTVRPAWVLPARADRCPVCVLGVRSSGTGHRHRRVDLTWWSRLAARVRFRFRIRKLRGLR